MKSVFKSYYDKLVKIGILKSVVFSLIVGFGVNFIVAFITCFIDMSVSAVLASSLGSGALAAVISAPLFYFFAFKPTTKKMAAILDKQGLEERIITMVELENDQSYIAMAQRENALNSLEKVSPKSLKVALSTLIVVILVASVTLGISMTTVTTLAAADIISVGSKTDEGTNDPAQDEDENLDEETVSILYEAGAHGSVEGQLFQQLQKGGDASAVVAIPDEGYEFLYWTDGTFTAERRDTNVNVSFSVKAVFREKSAVGDGQGGEGNGQGGGGEGNGQGGNNGQGGQNGDGGGGGDGQGEGDGDENQGQGGGGAGASGKQDNNTVIDGSQDYRDAADYEALKEQIESDDSLTQEEKDMLLAYLKMLYGEGKGE